MRQYFGILRNKQAVESEELLIFRIHPYLNKYWKFYLLTLIYRIFDQNKKTSLFAAKLLCIIKHFRDDLALLMNKK